MNSNAQRGIHTQTKLEKLAFWVHISDQQGTITWIPPLKEMFLLFKSTEMN